MLRWDLKPYHYYALLSFKVKTSALCYHAQNHYINQGIKQSNATLWYWSVLQTIILGLCDQTQTHNCFDVRYLTHQATYISSLLVLGVLLVLSFIPWLTKGVSNLTTEIFGEIFNKMRKFTSKRTINTTFFCHLMNAIGLVVEVVTLFWFVTIFSCSKLLFR